MVNKYCNNQKITINESWGKISGNIEDQKDLVDYIESHGSGEGVSKEYVDTQISQVRSEIPSTDDFVSHEEFEEVKSEQATIKEKVDELPQADNIADKEWVEGQGYLTEHQSLVDYALKSEIPSLEGYATEEWVEGKGYLTEHQTLKTINNQSLIGEGNIEIQGGGGGDTSNCLKLGEELDDTVYATTYSLFQVTT